MTLEQVATIAVGVLAVVLCFLWDRPRAKRAPKSQRHHRFPSAADEEAWDCEFEDKIILPT